MRNISARIKITGIISISLWIIGSFLIYNETNGKGIFISSVVIIGAGLYSQMKKDQKENSEL